MPSRRVVVTGAGSGTGAAVARLIAQTRPVALVGRRADRLQDVADGIEAAGGDASIHPADLTRVTAEELLAQIGPISDLVCAAGLNTPRRDWGGHVGTEFDAIITTNLSSVAHLISAALPQLRESAGSVVLVSSLSAWMTSPGAGYAYRASKMGLRALTEALNEQEAVHGVRGMLVLPGDIDSEFLTQRPSVPGDEARKKMLSPEDVATAVVYALTAPPHLRIDELVITPLGTVNR
ncbi:MAG: SDR family oxidoreductase [Mycetocola sp.]